MIKEIVVTPAAVNLQYGVRLKMRLSAEGCSEMLDEQFGNMNWTNQYQQLGSRIYCTIGVREDSNGSFVCKSACSQADDADEAFSNTALCFGIGREISEMHPVIPRSCCNITQDERGVHCSDRFVVSDLQYGRDGRIEHLAIKNATKPFRGNVVYEYPAETSTSTVESKPTNVIMDDNEVLLFGNCKKQKYGDVKNTPEFAKFMVWIKDHGSYYSGTKDQQEQFGRLRMLAASM